MSQYIRYPGSNIFVTANRAVVSDSNGALTASAVTSTELGYVSGVTSAIQTQIDAKAAYTATASYTPTITGCGTVSNNTAYWTKIGKVISVTGSFTAGTVAASAFTISLPGGNTINTSANPATGLALLGHIYRATNADNVIPSSSYGPFPISFVSTSTGIVHVANVTNTGAGAFPVANGSSVLATGNSAVYSFQVVVS